MKTEIGGGRIVAVALIASVVLAACGTISNEKGSSASTNKRAAPSPQLKPDYPCQNLHVKPTNCPPR